MKTLKAFLLLMVFVGPTWGTTFTGTISGLVTEAQGPDWYVGQTFYGWYSYESDTVDGQYVSAFAPPGGQNVLSGNIGLPPSWEMDFRPGYPWVSILPPRLSVANGVVQDFNAFGEVGGNFGFSADSFSVLDYYSTYTMVAGTLAFSAPAPAVAAVPESVSTVWLLSGSMLSLVVIAGMRRSSESRPGHA